MATAPAYAVTPRIGGALVPATQDTSFTAPTHVSLILSAGANGTKVNRIDVLPVGTTVQGVVNIFLYDGSTYHLHESVLVLADTVGAVNASPKTPYTYEDLVLPNGWSLYCSNTEASNVSIIEVNAFGADL